MFVCTRGAKTLRSSRNVSLTYRGCASGQGPKKVCVVIGVGPGVGTAAAKKFASEGYHVAMVSRSDEQMRENQVAISEDGNPHSFFITGDVSDPEQCKKVFERIHGQLGTVNVLVYNTCPLKPFPGGIVDDIPALSSTPIAGALECCKHIVSRIVEDQNRRKKEGKLKDEDGKSTILFTGSALGKRGLEQFTSSSAAAAGLLGLSQSLARELGPKDIHVAHVTIHDAVLPSTWRIKKKNETNNK